MTGTLKEYKIDKNINLFDNKENKSINKSDKKVGRPKMEIKRKRKSIVLYLYDDEYEKLKNIAKLESMSSFIRGFLKEKFDM